MIPRVWVHRKLGKVSRGRGGVDCRPWELGGAVYLHTIPNAAPTALILSHDVDAQTSFVDSLKFADLARQYDASATFFENTKYFADWKDIDYYNIPENLEAIRELRRRGFDIGSHTVSHYTQLDSAPLGDPDVTFAQYDPANEVTLFGEVRVSKELLLGPSPGSLLGTLTGYRDPYDPG